MITIEIDKHANLQKPKIHYYFRIMKSNLCIGGIRINRKERIKNIKNLLTILNIKS